MLSIQTFHAFVHQSIDFLKILTPSIHLLTIKAKSRFSQQGNPHSKRPKLGQVNYSKTLGCQSQSTKSMNLQKPGGCSKRPVLQGRRDFGARSVHGVREGERRNAPSLRARSSDKAPRTPLADFFNSPPILCQQSGQASLTSVLFLLALIVGGMWGWSHLSFDTQDIIIEEVIPVLLAVLLVGILMWRVIKTVRDRKHRLQRRDQLMEKFKQERSRQKKFDIVVALVELNNYELAGLEPLATEMAEVCVALFKRSIGDKAHRIRGIAASHLGTLQHRDSIPLLMRALEDDHAYVRSSAALALGRMRAMEAKEKLKYTMKEDWDQTVRSRSREAVDRMN